VTGREGAALHVSEADQVIRIASGQGFWGDRLNAPVEQMRRGQIDYLMLDYLAEVTMSIMQKQVFLEQILVPGLVAPDVVDPAAYGL
jgi:hypothetical protein